jgi:OPT oligopeptide transporter protein
LLLVTSGVVLILVLPVGITTAVTGNSITLNVIGELIGGFVVPGNALVVNMFKAYSCMTLWNAISLSGDLKLGYYTKIPPRVMFRAQMISTLYSVILVSLSTSTLTDIDSVGHELATQ